MNTGLYKREFPDFNDLTGFLAKLPLRYEDMSWHNDACPRFDISLNPGEEYPSLVLWVSEEDKSQREMDTPRFMLILANNSDDFLSGETETILEGDDEDEIIKAITRFMADRLNMEFTFIGEDHVLAMSINGMAIINPFLSECGRFIVNPATYDVPVDQLAFFLNQAPIEQVRNIISETIGNTEVFDAQETEQKQRDFAIEYLREAFAENSTQTGADEAPSSELPMLNEAEIEELAHAALDEACLLIQNRLGVKTGDFAGVFFSGGKVLNDLKDYIRYEQEHGDR